MNNARLKTAPNREKRHATITAFIGDSGTLLEEYQRDEVQQRIRTFSQSTSDDLVAALRVVSRIRNVAVIIHGPEGCSAGFSYLTNKTDLKWASTQLDERDTIMGADEKLRSAVATLYNRHKPQAIIIVATPSVAINNDDIQSVVDELTGELGVPIIPVFVSGFSSKAGISGNDMALHALLKFTQGETDEADGEFLNLISVNELPEDIKELQCLLDVLKIPRQILPDTAEPRTFEKASQASATVGIDIDTAEYAGLWLEKASSVPWIQTSYPAGLVATKDWLTKIGEHFGKAHAARDLHAAESVKCAPLLSEPVLSGKRVFLEGSPSKVFGLHALVHELGGSISGLSLTHFDKLHLPSLKKLVDEFPQTPIHIGENQAFETINLIKRDIPDLFIGTTSTAVHASAEGVPSISIDQLAILGYSGLSNFADVVRKTLRLKGFINAVSGTVSPLKTSWLQRSPNWHIKQEVK
jgi:nitrogenase molybdenum-iron protein alpha/beta subunit